MRITRVARVFLPIAAPCNADWHKMSGDDQVRFCATCDQKVHNLSADQPLPWSVEPQARLCVRIQREGRRARPSWLRLGGALIGLQLQIAQADLAAPQKGVVRKKTQARSAIAVSKSGESKVAPDELIEHVPQVPPAHPGTSLMGAVNREVLRGALQGFVAAAKACYEDALKSQPELSGKVSMRFHLRDGKVQKAEIVESQMKGSERPLRASLGLPSEVRQEERANKSDHLEACLVAAAKNVPAVDDHGEAIVIYPFVFAPAH